MTLRPKMCATLVHARDSDVVANEKLQQHIQHQQSKKQLVAGVGLFVSIAVTVVALVFAVLASDPLDAKLAERAATTSTDVSGDIPSELLLQQQRREIDAFFAWFEASGGVRHEHIGIADFPGMGKGAKALTLSPVLCIRTVITVVLHVQGSLRLRLLANTSSSCLCP